ncbi:MAG TPA: ATPase domain-containing protein [Patescibacteria group bacterium]|nr:ATPase domain-containing protein [Patescibacteria group bacterium]
MKDKKRPARKAPGSSMNQPGKVKIRPLPTGVRGLDEIMGGGLPEFSFNIIAGSPGCGKTTLAHQIIFANATPQKPAIYFTVLGEPALKMLRYQQQYTFFDPTLLKKAIRFINLSDVLLEKNLDGLLEEITREVQASDPGMVVVDSFRTVVRKALDQNNETELQFFIQRLALFLTTWQATTFLIGEYSDQELRDNPVFTVADGIFWLTQVAERNSVVRKLQIVKLRGQESVPGLHTIRIGSGGVQAFSRTLGLAGRKPRPMSRRRLSIGIAELDKMLGGGVLEGDSVLVSGPSGTGKSALATQFLAEGLRHGESVIAAIFEERPLSYAARARSFGLDLETPQAKGKLEMLYLRPLDLSVDETMQAILDTVTRINAKRLVIDSLVGFEMALAPGFRADFRESLYRMIAALTGAGVTILTTVEIEDTFTSFEFSHYTISFLTDDIIRMRYVEIDGQLRKVIVVVKMRGSNHSKDIREYVITNKGVMVISPRHTEYERLSSGLPERIGQAAEEAPEPKAGSERNRLR